jgi:EAL domain-containing protein (putative c-di-GMP-specific phosphodiesterase class I)
MLREWGCDEGQGYLMSRPVSAQRIFDAGREAVARPHVA